MTKIEKKIQRILEASEHKASELSVVFADDEYIRKLNKEYRGLDRATDVLSFSQTEGEFSSLHSWILGDVVISAEWALRESEERGHHLDVEIDFLLIHGILHLLGFDHEKSKEERVDMEKREEELLGVLADEAR